MNKLLANAIFASGSPISIAENASWKQFFKALRPSYKVPTRRAISTKYLDSIYTDMKKDLEDEIGSADNLNLQMDGWTNIRNESIINFIITTPKPTFVKFLNTEDNKHTAEYLADEIIKVLLQFDVQKCFCLIGDNAKNVQKAFKIIQSKYPHLNNLGCLAHSLHLLCGDILKSESVSKFMAKVIDLVKKIKAVHILNASFIKINKEKGINTSLKLPCATRWGSSLNCLVSMKTTKSTLQQLAVSDASQGLLTPNMKSTLLDDEIFWVQIDKMIHLLSPIITWIGIIQTREPIIHKVIDAVTDIENALKNSLGACPIKKKKKK